MVLVVLCVGGCCIKGVSRSMNMKSVQLSKYCVAVVARVLD